MCRRGRSMISPRCLPIHRSRRWACACAFRIQSSARSTSCATACGSPTRRCGSIGPRRSSASTTAKYWGSRRTMHGSRISAMVAAGLMLVMSAASAQAQSPAEFYKGKRLTLITSASVGGGYDQYARLLAKHMPRFIPGNPSIVVQNMVGAEGIRAANFLYNVAAQDGSVIGGLSRNNGLAKFYDVQNAQVQFDARKFHWLGSPQQEIGLFVL